MAFFGRFCLAAARIETSRVAVSYILINRSRVAVFLRFFSLTDCRLVQVVGRLPGIFSCEGIYIGEEILSARNVVHVRLRGL